MATNQNSSLLAPAIAATSPASPVSPSAPAYEVSRQRQIDEGGVDLSLSEQQDLFLKSLDIDGMTNEGYSSRDIVDLIGDMMPGGFDVKGARSNFDDDDEILQEIGLVRPEGEVAAFAREAARSLIKGVPTVGGGIMGGMIGTPGGPVTMAGGAIAGSAAGMEFGEALDSMLFDDSLPYAPGVRPLAKSGETLGFGLTFLGAPYTRPIQAGVLSTVNNISKLNGTKEATLRAFKDTPLDVIRRRAVETPGAFLLVEGMSLGGSSVGTFYADRVDPGNELTRFGMEIAGGAGGVLSNLAVNAAIPTVKNILNKFTNEGRLSNQGTALKKFLEDGTQGGPENVDALLTRLSDGDELSKIASELGVPLNSRTTANATGSNKIQFILDTLSQEAEMGPTVKKAVRKNYEGMSNLLDLMIDTGDPQLVSLATELRLGMFNGMIAKRLDKVNAKAQKSINQVFPKKTDADGNVVDDPKAAMKAGIVVEDLTNQAIVDVRKQEKELYDLVDATEEMDIATLGEALDSLKLKLNDETADIGIIPSFVRNLIAKSRGIDVAADETNLERLDILKKKIIKDQDAISDQFATDRFTKKFLDEEINENLSLEDQLRTAQEIIRKLEFPFADFKTDYMRQLTGDITARDQTRYLTVVKAKARIINNQMKIADLTAAQAVPAENFDTVVTIGEVMRARNLLLNAARDRTGKGEFSEAHFLSDLADAAKDDFGIKAGGPEAKELTPNQIALKDAFAFSKALNDTFSRAFPGTVLAKNNKGARRVMPELLSAVTFRGGGDATSLKYSQLENAMTLVADNLDKDLGDTVAGRLGTMRGAQETLLRSAFEKTVNIVPKTDGSGGQLLRVDPEKLLKFKKDNRNVLFDAEGNSKFPEFTKDLDSADSAERAFRTQLDLTGDPRVDTLLGSAFKGAKPKGVFQKKIVAQNAFAAHLDKKLNPAKHVGSVIGSPGDRPKEGARGLRTMIFNAKNAEAKHPGAMDGLRDVILERAFSFADNGETISFKAFDKFLNDPMTRGQPSLLSVMKEGGLLNDGAILRLNTLLKEGAKQETLLTAEKGAIGGSLLDLPMTKLDIATTAMQRIVGLRLGRYATQKIPGTGQGLAEPGIFANLTDRVLSSVPNALANDMIVEAALNPEFFKILMSKAGNTRRAEIVLNNQLRSFLLGAGFVAADDALFDDGEKNRRSMNIRSDAIRKKNNPPVSVPEKVSSVAPTAMPTPQPVPAQRVAPPTSTLASVSPPPPAASGPIDRDRYKALFPNDGIASLFG